MKNCAHRVTMILLLIVASFSITSAAPSALSKIIYARFTSFWHKIPQEKAYLQTDKPYYSASENIWFTGYVVNATTLQPNTLSNFLYVELVDKSDSVLSRVKIKRDSLSFSGCIKLDAEIPSGYYALRAYTSWMQNTGTDFFFSKHLYIGNSIDDRASTQISYGKEVNGKIPVTINFFNASKKPLIGYTIKVAQNWIKTSKKTIQATTSNEGKISFQAVIDSKDPSLKVLDISIDDPALKYRTKFFLPQSNNDFDVQFFPESGSLIANNLQTIAFKAIGTDGLSMNVTGKIYAKDSTEIADISTFHNGMGRFIMQAQPDDSFYAIVTNDKGVTKRFDLPKVAPEGVVLHLSNSRGRIVYEISNLSQRPNSSLYMMAHARGKMLIMQQLDNLSGQIMESSLPNGIITFSILDSLANTLCERLVFVKNPITNQLNVVGNKAVYGKRDSVFLSLSLSGGPEKSLYGNFSVSVTDSKLVKKDTLADNIWTNLLLTSDLKGYLEQPNTYFTGNENLYREKLDVLMMTQGWRRFSTSNIVKGIFPSSKYFMEIGQALSGKVLNILNKPSKNCDIFAFSPARKIIRIEKTDSLGMYLINGIDFPDSTTFLLKAKKKKTIGDVEIIPDKDEFLKFSSYIPTFTNTINAASTDYFKQMRDKYYYEGGMRLINLNEVEVRGKRIPKDQTNSIYAGMAQTEISADRIKENETLTLMMFLSTIPGVEVIGEDIKIRNSSGSPLILIDDLEAQDITALSYLNMTEIEHISVFKGADAAIFGSRGGNGAISVTLKRGAIFEREKPISMATFKPLGYQLPVEFYMPKYSIDSERLNQKPDLRTTIYWNPKVVTDSTGNAKVKFYTADKPNNYNIIVEGITKEGEIYRYSGILRREGF